MVAKLRVKKTERNPTGFWFAKDLFNWTSLYKIVRSSTGVQSARVVVDVSGSQKTSQELYLLKILTKLKVCILVFMSQILQTSLFR